MRPERLLADEMLGRLARYLRFVGCDTAYARDRTDDEIVRWAATEGRFLLTRDRALARRVPESLWIRSPGIEGQWREVRTRCTDLPTHVRFARCTRCNGEVRPVVPPPTDGGPIGLPVERIAAGLPVYRCDACGHLYWAGSHSSDVQRRIDRWATEGGE
ncbi:protein containing DUF82 [mine drainage metagenome]|uniref:Protein containing DUF82 n=1 Tax=mine drainage metagenome TaxID=410659 RepID=T1AYJ8_9ZZZZ